MDASKEDHQSKASNTEIVRSFLFPAGPWPAFLNVPTLPEKIPKRLRERKAVDRSAQKSALPARLSYQQKMCCQQNAVPTRMYPIVRKAIALQFFPFEPQFSPFGPQFSRFGLSCWYNVSSGVL